MLFCAHFFRVLFPRAKPHFLNYCARPFLANFLVALCVCMCVCVRSHLAGTLPENDTRKVSEEEGDKQQN